MRVNKAIKHLRTKNNLTQVTLSVMLNINIGRLRHLEAGTRNLTHEERNSYLKAFNLTSREFNQI